jgi:hypothetical protein
MSNPASPINFLLQHPHLISKPAATYDLRDREPPKAKRNDVQKTMQPIPTTKDIGKSTELKPTTIRTIFPRSPQKRLKETTATQSNLLKIRTSRGMNSLHVSTTGVPENSPYASC